MSSWIGEGEDSSKARRASQGWSEQATDPNVEAALEQRGVGAVATALMWAQSNCPPCSEERLPGFSLSFTRCWDVHTSSERILLLSAKPRPC